jgi:DNA-binding beta-propeller fold protein YncE
VDLSDVSTPREKNAEVGRERQRPRRRYASGRSGSALAATVAALVVAAPHAAGSGSVPRRNSLVLVNATKNAIVARIPLGAEPLRVSFGEGMFWVVTPDARTVLAIDPRTRKAHATKLGREPFDAATGGGALWVADHDSHRILRVDLQTGAITRSNDLESPQLAIAYGFGAVWAVNAGNSLLRLDPTTMAVTATIDNVASSYEGYEPKIAIASDAIWVSDSFKHAVARVDPERLEVTYRRAIAGNGIAVGAGGVWSADGATSVWRFANGRTRRVRAGAGPIDVAAGPHAVWAVNWRGQSLVRINATRGRVVKRFRLGREPVAVAVGGAYVGAIVH